MNEKITKNFLKEKIEILIFLKEFSEDGAMNSEHNRSIPAGFLKIPFRSSENLFEKLFCEREKKSEKF